jgi:predicted ABC-type ATPase
MSKTQRPTLWIVAGPNGSGKSTLYEGTIIEDFGRSVWIINPDRLTQRIVDQERLDIRSANGAALDRIMDWLKASVAAHQTVGVETVLSTDKYQELVIKAKTLGFEIRLIYVILRSPELSVERVKRRASMGGHHVAESDVVRRFGKSLLQLPWFLDQADRAFFYDNSGSTPKRVAEKRADGRILLDPEAPAPLKSAILSLDRH